jgi:hypothetical protein
VRITRAGAYQAEIVYACETNSAGSEFTLAVGDQTLTGRVVGTGEKAGAYKALTIGTVNIKNPGTVEVALKPTKKPGAMVMNLRAVVLQPVKNEGDERKR